jgi:hypothetical protein
VNTITSLIGRLMSKMRSGSARTGTQETTAAGSPPRDFTLERETGRVGNLSAEDQAWEAASRKRNREAQARGQTPPGDG